MRNSIKSIKEKVPQIVTLPDGYYNVDNIKSWGLRVMKMSLR